jgi:hypothetical protein
VTAARARALLTIERADDPIASSAFLRQIVKVIARIRMDVSQCEAVISEDASVVVDAEGKIAEHHAIHRVLFAVEAVYVSGCEKERRTGLEDA